MLDVHLLQTALVYLNTRLMQNVLADTRWDTRLNDHDRRALRPVVGSGRTTAER